MPIATFLVGLPASGKTTFRELTDPYTKIASSDDYIETMARLAGKTYNDVFELEIGDATRHFDRTVSDAIVQGMDFLIDRTNLSVKSRKKILQLIPEDWEKRAIVIKCLDMAEWAKRLKSRPGKTIPDTVIGSMLKSFEFPTKEEGFDEIMTYYT